MKEAIVTTPTIITNNIYNYNIYPSLFHIANKNNILTNQILTVMCQTEIPKHPPSCIS